jgi:hypothetical protein
LASRGALGVLVSASSTAERVRLPRDRSSTTTVVDDARARDPQSTTRALCNE